MTNTLNVYDNIRTPQIKNTTTIDQWFNLIKKSDYSELIEQARPFKKGSPVYDNVKASIPAITYNFTFKSKKSNANITGATGLMYIDIDDLSFDLSSLDLRKVFAYYRSFGGVGYSILVQVNSLTLDNYNSTYGFILNQLGLDKYYDAGAKKATQFNVLSYDPDIFINYDSFVFTATNETKNSPPSSIIKKEKTYIDREGGISYINIPLRYDNLNEIKFEGNYTFNWDGWTYVNAWLPFNKIKTGKRSSTLLSFLNNFVWLNPQLNQKGAETLLNSLNKSKCEEPLTPAQINSIVRSIYKYKASGTLKPIFNRNTRKILFAPQTGLNAKEKLAICRELLAEKNQNNSLQKLNGIIAGWDFERYGKIGQTAIHKNFPISKKTVEKYWSYFIDEVRELNDNWKNFPTNNRINEPLLNLAGGQENAVTTEKELVITNSERYRRGTQLLPFLEKRELEARLTFLLNSGVNGEVQLEADDTAFVFKIGEAVEFVGFGELIVEA